jgi:hypothetical protein
MGSEVRKVFPLLCERLLLGRWMVTPGRCEPPPPNWRTFGAPFPQRLSGLSRVRLLEKRKTVEPFPAFPQPRLLLAEFCEGESRRRCELGAMLTYLASFGVKSDEQFVGYGDADDFGRLAGGAQALLEGDEVRFVPSDHAADDEQDFADCRAASAHRSFSLVLA